MANRVIRDWTTSESVDELSPKAEVFFTRLIMKADDYGNYTGNPRLISAALFPLKMYDVLSITQWMEECEKQGLIVMYTHDNKKYIHIPNYGQTLRRMKAVYPAPNIDGSVRTSVGQVSDNDGQMTAETKRSRNEVETETEVEKNFKSEFKTFDNWNEWGTQIVNKNDHHWQAMKGREISQAEMDSFLSVATRNDWKMNTQQQFRTSLKGFKSTEHGKHNRTNNSAVNTKSFSGEYKESL